jgi:hypothetical protein
VRQGADDRSILDDPGEPTGCMAAICLLSRPVDGVVLRERA